MNKRIHVHTNKFPVIAYQKTGSGPVLVLIHGFPENGDLWHKIVPQLSASNTLLIPDLPGAGESSFLGEDLTMETMATAVYEVLKAESVDKAILAGHSMGGYMAFAFANTYPQMMKGLALVHSSAYPDDEAKKDTRRKSIELIRKGGRETFIKQMTPNLFSKWFKEQHFDTVQRQIERGLMLPGESMISFYNSMINRVDHTKVLAEAAYPVQWIIGTEDTAVLPEKVVQQAKLSDINFVSVYTDCAHMSMLEHPEKLAADLSEFSLYCNNR